MILIIHIIAALSSLGFTGWAFVSPDQNKINAAYVTTAVMLLTGFGLVLSKPGHMTQTCIEGLVFLAIVSYGLVSARRKLTKNI